MERQKNHTLTFLPNPRLKRMDQVRQVLRDHHQAYRTKQTHCQWILRHIRHFGGKSHTNWLETEERGRVLSHPAPEGWVSASTTRQVLNALVFLHRDALHAPLARRIAPVRRERRLGPPTRAPGGDGGAPLRRLPQAPATRGDRSEGVMEAKS